MAEHFKEQYKTLHPVLVTTSHKLPVQATHKQGSRHKLLDDLQLALRTTMPHLGHVLSRHQCTGAMLDHQEGAGALQRHQPGAGIFYQENFCQEAFITTKPGQRPRVPQPAASGTFNLVALHEFSSLPAQALPLSASGSLFSYGLSISHLLF